MTDNDADDLDVGPNMVERPKPREWPVLGQSNGHTWIKPDWLFVEACRDCGVTRRGDDANSPCKGKAVVEFREAGN